MVLFSGNKAVGAAARSTGSASWQWQWLWGFPRVGFVDGTSVNRTGRGCLADLKLVFFCVKDVKPLEFLWSGAAVGWWQALVRDSCSPGTHSAPMLVT